MKTRRWMYNGVITFACALMAASAVSHLQAYASQFGSPAGIQVTSLDGGNTIGCSGTCMGLGGQEPGLPGDKQATSVAVRYQSHPTARLALRVSNYSAKSQSSDTTCTAADPASKLRLVISEDSTEIYRGTVSNFASRFGGSLSLPLPGGANGSWAASESHKITFTYGIDSSADSTYQGCSTRALFVWTAQA